MRPWLILVFLTVACAPPAAVPTPQSLGGGMVRYFPQSTSATLGRAYELTLWTHCGLDETLIDFGGVLWEPQVEQRAGGGVVAPPALVKDPADRGRITMRAVQGRRSMKPKQGTSYRCAPCSARET